MPGDKNSTCVSSRWNVSISVESHPHCKGCALSHLYVKVVFSAWLSLSLPVSLPTFKNHVFCDVSLLPAEIETPQPQNDKCIMKCNWWPSAQGKLFLISNARAWGALKTQHCPLVMQGTTKTFSGMHSQRFSSNVCCASCTHNSG